MTIKPLSHTSGSNSINSLPATGRIHLEGSTTSTDGMSTECTQFVLDVQWSQDGWYDFARTVILALARSREQLGYELSHAEGLIEPEEFDSIMDEYLEPERTIPDLLEKARKLAELVPSKVDAELVSVVFHCSSSDAEMALKSVASSILESRSPSMLSLPGDQ